MSLLEVERLNVAFEVAPGAELHVVKDVDMTLEAGDRLGLVGESGSGKTTTALAIMGLLPPNAIVDGDIRLNGVSLLRGGERSARPHRWKDVAMVFQGAMNVLNPVRRVGRQIAEPVRLHGRVSRKAANCRARETLALVGLPAGTAERYPFELSGGMRQRVCIAMALACEPQILIADEPTTALDVLIQAQILALLRGLTEELGLTLVLVTHDLPVVGQTCRQVAVMLNGGLVESGPVDRVMGRPSHSYTRALIEATPDLYDIAPPMSAEVSAGAVDAERMGSTDLTEPASDAHD